jgi:serine protease Do
MSTKGSKVLPAFVILMTLGIGILIGTMVSHGVRAAKTAPLAMDAKPLPAPSPVELSNSFAQVAEQLSPSVVNINTESTVRASRRRFHAPDDSPFGDFFDKFFDSPGAPQGDFRQQSLGSGVILSPNGYILTNYHVVTQSGEDKPVDKIIVYLRGDDTTKHPAKIRGFDRETDLAIVKIAGDRPLPAASLGDSDTMRVGDWVLAIGSPFGLDSTVTAGIVSAKGRDIEGGVEGQFKRFIQTDAAINPGNSGGPLVNLAGQVIGINTAIATQRGTYDGVGFAIPSNTARKVYNALVTSGAVQRGAIGVTFYSANNPALLRSFGTDHGIVINGVEPGSPAERAGLKYGDVIVSVDGKAIRTADELVAIVSETGIGKKLHTEYLRWPDGKRMTAEVEVGDRNKIVAELAETPPPARLPAGARGEQSSGVLGLSVKSLTHEQTQDLADKLHLDRQEGVLVANVEPSGFASDLGVHHGDIILSINHHPATSAEEFSRLQSSLKSGNDVLLLIARGSAPHAYTTLFLADRLP